MGRRYPPIMKQSLPTGEGAEDASGASRGDGEMLLALAEGLGAGDGRDQTCF